MDHIFKSKLILGTAQFGMPYGLVDHSKITDEEELIMMKIAKNALQQRDMTAMAYLVLSTPNDARSITRD